MDNSALKTLLDNLDSCRSSLDGWLDFWTFLVVIGVALEVIFVVCEYRKELHEFRQGTNNFRLGIAYPPEKPSLMLFVLGMLGAGLVAGGVSGELYVNVQAGKVETEIRKVNEQRFSLLSKEAGDAAASAKTAHDEADTVKREAAVIEERLGKASTQLTALEEEILIQGPRWGLLKRGENAFIEALKPFAGQKATVVICGQGDTERFALEQLLFNLLKEARWDNPGYRRWDGCPTMLTGGNEMYFVSAADTVTQWLMPYPCSAPCPAANEDRVAQAGRAFCDILRKLRIGTVGWMESPPRSADDEQAFSRARNFFANGMPGSPAELALREPSTIFILVGPHPPEFGIPQREKTKAKHAK
jgi:hypothetical protein